MSDDPRRIAPRSAIAGADLEPLTVALVELEGPVSDPAPTFVELARRLAGFRTSLPEDEVTGGIAHLRPIALPDRGRR